ncbi:YveK family protein [Marinococcus sp. PL1-022]|uniref:YveK family protein n=1 Tax=Marinococcus sp. PL1-022 TaxID=3095363 RepID=UPI0029C3AACE|nr:Wzz/FepE/Etk N-terminal domain-containing protein [Marinococcus sp. PL1-022]MDX6153998.1 Wzz/FepE/Etk N-terminal domain-containing protein [Marinococcus sp. PL1-022]
MEKTMSAAKVLTVLKKYALAIAAFAIIGGAVGAVYTYLFMTPVYEARAQILVNQEPEEDAAPGTELEANLAYINTYNVIIMSAPILEQVIEEANLNETVEELQSQITVAGENESQVASITVEDTDAKTAVAIANTTARVFEREVPNIMSVDNVSVLAPAKASETEEPVSPQPLFNIALALLIGAMTGIGFAFVREYFDRTIKEEEDVENNLGLPVLGTITFITDQTQGRPEEVVGLEDATRPAVSKQKTS